MNANVAEISFNLKAGGKRYSGPKPLATVNQIIKTLQNLGYNFQASM